MINFYPFRNKKGFTLIELMVVTALISILLGIGSAMLTNSQQKLSLKVSAFQTAAIIQSARNASMQENTSSKVNILQKENIFQVCAGKIAGYWHLEDTTGTGAFNFSAKVENCEMKEGKTGKSLHFQAGTSKITLGNWGLFSIDEGFALSFWIWPERIQESKEQILWEIPGHYVLGIAQDSTLFLQRKKSDITTQEIRLPLYQWSLIEIIQEPSEIFLTLDGIIRFQKPYDNRKDEIPPSSSIIIGTFFQGKIDEIKLLRKAVIVEWALPKELEIRKGPPCILFNSQGSPDPFLHSGGVVLILGKWESTEEASIFLSETGQIRIHY